MSSNSRYTQVLTAATPLKTRYSLLFVLLTLLSLSACNYLTKREPGIGKSVDWSKLPNWNGDNVAQALVGIQAQCPLMAKQQDSWKPICADVTEIANPTDSQARQFLQKHFVPHRIYGKYGKLEGLITGYYEPILNGSLSKTEQYAYPIYAVPDDMLTIELADLYPKLEGMRLRGRIEGNKIVPFHSREIIDGEAQPLAGKELLWIDDPYGSFFLQIQGSGKVQLEDGTMKGVNYADQNGHPYFAVGKKLVEMGELEIENVSLFTIRRWLKNNPSRADEVLNTNASYVFFTLREDVTEGPRGSLNVPLTAERSLAVDKSVIPLGTPVWLATSLPDGSDYQRLMVAQDTGGAISGPVRADVFFGTGERAELLAGEMKQQGRLYALLPVH